METKKYSSYEQIDIELEILKLQREINYRKLQLSVHKTKDNLRPRNLVGSLLKSNNPALSNSYETLFNTAVPLIFGWLSKRKGGD